MIIPGAVALYRMADDCLRRWDGQYEESIIGRYFSYRNLRRVSLGRQKGSGNDTVLSLRDRTVVSCAIISSKSKFFFHIN